MKILLCLACLALSSPTWGQHHGPAPNGLGAFAPQSPEPAQQEPSPLLPAEASPEARAAWAQVCAASRAEQGQQGPIRAFVIEAEVLTRDGVQTNEFDVEYRYLAPSFIRFKLPSGRETGRGPGERYTGYWFKEKEEIVRLVSRDHVEDRRLVDEMLAVAKNFLALSDLGRLRLQNLELVDQAPRGLPPELQRDGSKLDWIVVTSRDFALLGGTPPKEGDPAPLFRVDLGIDRKTHLPAMAMIFELRTQDLRPGVEPLLIRLDRYRIQDGFLVPHHLAVHRRQPGKVAFEFEPKAFQDIYVKTSRLRPELVEGDFEP